MYKKYKKLKILLFENQNRDIDFIFGKLFKGETPKQIVFIFDFFSVQFWKRQGLLITLSIAL